MWMNFTEPQLPSALALVHSSALALATPSCASVPRPRVMKCGWAGEPA